LPVRYGLCNFCDASCGLEIEVEGREILSIRGDREDFFSRGHVCPKGVAQQDLYRDPDRLRTPLRREGSSWREISWDEAFAITAERAAAVQKRHGKDALAFYFGNPVSHQYATLLHLVPFARGLRTRNVYSAGSVDSFARMLVSQLLYGSPAILPVPDINRTRYFLILGANPAVSNGSIMTAPDCRNRLKELTRRGAKMVVIDPRRTETAELADEHHFIVPGTDALFLLAMLHEIFERGTARHALPVPYDHLDRVEEIARDFPPERVARRTGIDPETIRRLAAEFAAAPTAVCYGRMGTAAQRFGALVTWLIDVLNLVTGNLDRPGGSMFTTPAVDLAGLAARLGVSGSFRTYRSRVGGLPELNGELPVAALADEMETTGPGQIKGLITLAGNPVLSLPNGARLERLLPGLEFMVSIDFYLN
jgi:anaerobic selenocysteine-containing dehydrogenase